jgi:hypothetical protein
MSGLNQRFTKPSTFNRVREFESHILRLRRAEATATARQSPPSSKSRKRDSPHHIFHHATASARHSPLSVRHSFSGGDFAIHLAILFFK